MAFEIAFLNPLSEKLASLAVETIKGVVDGLLKSDQLIKARVGGKESKEAIDHHISFVSNWAREITAVSFGRSQSITQSFVDLDLTMSPLHLQDEEKINRELRISDLVSNPANTAILGEPGAGKTTSLKRLCMETLHGRQSGSPRFPVLILLRDLRVGDTLRQKIFSILGIGLTFPTFLTDSEEEKRQKRSDIDAKLQRIFVSTLDQMNALLVLEGLDELNPVLLHDIEQEIRTLLLSLNQAQVVISSRNAAFSSRFDRCRVLQICPLSQAQIKMLSSQLLGEHDANLFLEQIRLTPYHGAEMRPLLLAMLCALYERRGEIPSQPRDVYRTLITLLLEEWDQQRSIRRLSAYANFLPDHKREFLARFAFELTSRLGKFEFSHDELEYVYKLVCTAFELPPAQADEVTREIESHSGLIVRCGHERYAFAHRSFHEYFAAYFIHGLPRIPKQKDLLRFPEACAIATAMSSNSSAYFAEIVRSMRDVREPSRSSFLLQFVRRVVVERPDFEHSADLGLAFVEIYTCVWNSIGRKSSDKRFADIRALASRGSVRSSVQRFFLCCSTAPLPGSPVNEVLWDDDAAFFECVGQELSDDALRRLENPLYLDPRLLRQRRVS